MPYPSSGKTRTTNLHFIFSSITLAITIASPLAFAQPSPNQSLDVVGIQQPLTFRADFSALKNPQQSAQSGTTLQLKLPLPEGGDAIFTLTDSNVMPPELAQRYPQIRSWKGADPHGRQIRLDLSDRGVRAIVFDQHGTWRIQPACTTDQASCDPDNYLSFRATASASHTIAHSTQSTSQGEPAGVPRPSLVFPVNNHQREYRLAVATTSAYSQLFGGSVDASLASVVETINRVNAVFERDLGIHLTLVKDNDKLMFTDPATDPYRSAEDEDEEDFGYSRTQNVRVLREIIGNENFDVGHLFEVSLGGGAITGVCDDHRKADAASGLNPEDDDTELLSKTFIDTVIHELGHQFSADHTFNGCVRDSDATFEPGSGSTIMSYASECFLSTDWPPVINPLHNLQDHKDTYFHAKNIEQVRDFTSGAGAACGVERINPNRPPVITTPYGDRSVFIPAHTAFALTGQASSAVANAQLTYTWEQIDLGPEQSEHEALSDKAQGPIFRSYPPTLDGTRTFPKLEAVLAEQRLNGEIYPSTTRELNFRLTVRDNLVDLASTAYIDQKIHVLDTGQAFAVTQPASSTTWQAGTAQAVSWNVAGTAQAPIACQTVRIDLSLDGGHTYLTQPLLASTANTGQAQVTLPALDRDSTQARIRLSCNSSVFFAVSPANFNIVQ